MNGLIHVERAKFSHSRITADGKPRAQVPLTRLETLWFCTGTLCNLTCEHCYIESSPSNDALVYLTCDEVDRYLDEIEALGLGTREIGLTGGEPFMNPDIIGILRSALSRGFEVLVLTNAMKPMMKLAELLLSLKRQYGDRLTVRVSVDHHSAEKHQQERGERSWQPMIEGLQWLSAHGFNLRVAGRTFWNEDEHAMRKGFSDLFVSLGIGVDAHDPAALVLFPEMTPDTDVPEITTECWDILGVRPADIMCASSRMVIKHKGAAHPVVAACTLLPYELEFNLAETLADALEPIWLNHEHCAKFCVLGGGNCS
ncbi:MAG: radical SAM protein [Gammaproteobacteria bacterium]|nr:radical SAM protein [Gammaproteobacteria bacterium]